MRWFVPAGSSGSLKYDKSGPDVLELRGDVGRVEHDHGLTFNIGWEARNSWLGGGKL